MVPPITGRCYCGRTALNAALWPHSVSYCHCPDCRRITGAPVAAFAGFPSWAVTFRPGRGPAHTFAEGVERWFCTACGSPLAAAFDYLPGQLFLPLGLIDQASDLPPSAHAHHGRCLPWLQIVDDARRYPGSARDILHKRGKDG